MGNQFIYRQERKNKFDVTAREGLHFVFCGNPFGLFEIINPLLSVFSAGQLLKLIVKLSTPSRMFYCVISQNKIVGHGYITVSRCRHYKVEKGAVVIGPVWTREECRGKGVATFGLQNAMNALINKGIHIFYIDTAEINVPMQHVIAKSGFGEPVERCVRTKGCSV